MEATLFWVGISLGIYAYVLRKVENAGWLERFFSLVVFFHVFFLGIVGYLIGMIAAASFDVNNEYPWLPYAGVLGGMLFGFLHWLWKKLRRKEDECRKVLKGDQEWVETSFSAVILAAVIMYAVVQAFKIPSGSMRETLIDGDHLFVNKFIYGVRVPYSDRRVAALRKVERGDIVVFDCPEAALTPSERERGIHKDYIKRAVGLAGDVIEIKDKRLYRNGRKIDEPYVVYRDPNVHAPQTIYGQNEEYQRAWEQGELAQIAGYSVRDNFGPVTVPRGAIFCMGDNRDASFDSRFWGPMPLSRLKGRAWVLYWPFQRIRLIH